MIGMRNVQDTFETHKRSFIRASSICMTVPLNGRKGFILRGFICDIIRLSKELLKHKNKVRKLFNVNNVKVNDIQY